MKNVFKIKALICAVLAAVMCFSGCSVDLSSSEKEKETVMRVGDYDVPYEVFRYYVMNFRADGVDNAEEKAVDAIKDLYAMTAVAEKYGIDPDGEYVSYMVDSAVSETIAQCGGEKKYKKSIAESNMNDSVFRLLTKNDVLREEIYAKMIKEGYIVSDTNNMREIIMSDEFICVKQILILGDSSNRVQDGTVFMPAAEHTDAEAMALAEEAREKAVSGEDFDELVSQYGESLYMFSNTEGYYICRGMWESENEDAAFSLEIGEVSEVVKSSAGYSVFKRCEKSSEYVDKNISSILNNYYGANLILSVEDMAMSMSVEILSDVVISFPDKE